MTTKPVTYTIPKKLDAALHAKLGRGEISQFVTRALWDALKREEDALLLECLEADKDLGNIEVKTDFAAIEGEDFEGIEEFDFGENEEHERKPPQKRRNILGTTRSNRWKRNK